MNKLIMFATVSVNRRVQKYCVGTDVRSTILTTDLINTYVDLFNDFLDYLNSYYHEKCDITYHFDLYDDHLKYIDNTRDYDYLEDNFL